MTSEIDPDAARRAAPREPQAHAWIQIGGAKCWHWECRRCGGALGVVDPASCQAFVAQAATRRLRAERFLERRGKGGHDHIRAYTYADTVAALESFAADEADAAGQALLAVSRQQEQLRLFDERVATVKRILNVENDADAITFIRETAATLYGFQQVKARCEAAEADRSRLLRELEAMTRELDALHEWKKSAITQLAKSQLLHDALNDKPQYLGWDVYEAVVHALKKAERKPHDADRAPERLSG